MVKRGRALVEAHDVLIMLREGDELVIAAGAGHVHDRRCARGCRWPGSTAGEVLADGPPRRIADAARELADPARAARASTDASTALLVPLVYRGQSLGVLAAFDRLDGDGAFTREDEQLLEAFAAQAATAVATAKSVEADRRRRSLAAAEAERRRWARELHDETLQALGGLKVLLSSAARLDDPEAMRAAMREATRAADRRHRVAARAHRRAAPAGARPARAGARRSTSLAQRTASGQRARGPHRRRAPRRHAPGARARDDGLPRRPGVADQRRQARRRRLGRARRALRRRRGRRVAWPTTAIGFDPDGAVATGFGLAGMRERVELAGGELSVLARRRRRDRRSARGCRSAEPA